MNKKEYKQAAAADEAMMVSEPAVGYDDATVVAKPCPQLLLTIEDESMIKDIREALEDIRCGRVYTEDEVEQEEIAEMPWLIK